MAGWTTIVMNEWNVRDIHNAIAEAIGETPMPTEKAVALTWLEYDDMVSKQHDPVKRAELLKASEHTSRESGDKIYVEQRLIDALRTPIVREEDVREIKR